MLEARHLECQRGERRLFAGLSFTLAGGELLHVQGRNGAGKTSLLRMLLGLTPPAAGDILWHGQEIRQLAEAYRAELFYLGHHNAVKGELTAIENLRVNTWLAAEPLAEADAEAALARVGLGGREDVPVKFLSQGQQRRVALARLIHERRALWVLDEPFVALDVAAVELVAGLIGDHLQRGGLAVLTTHQAVDIKAGAIRPLVLQ